jgi:formamidopyrimidine-DNA glycosylase
MPELPEVENVRLGLESLLPEGSRCKSVRLLRPDLRFPFPDGLEERIRGQVLQRIFRRAKYLVFEFDNFQIVSHLGMTGSWRAFDEAIAHDHLIWEFENGPTLVFNDPRRFGFITLFEKGASVSHFENLGPEPLEAEFTADYLFEESRGRTSPMKTFLLDQKTVAGLGNIYVCEALYLAKISPLRKAGQLKNSECAPVVAAIRKVLQAAIKAGGSTIRDYRRIGGESGGFQDRFKVYDRAGEKCKRGDGGLIKTKRQAGRSSFWCPKCQK